MQNIYLTIFLSLLFYFIGSVPTAYILLKKLHKKDITKEGSGNVGAMNSYDVSGSKKTGILVFLLDFLKGLIPTLLVLKVFSLNFDDLIIPLSALVIGHNYSVWLRYKGGRGLSTAAGILVVINYWAVVIWCLLYLLSLLIKKNVHIDNTVATILLPFMLLILNSQGLMCNCTGNINFGQFLILCSIICFVVFLKHISPILNLIRKNDKSI